jgi:hypothetical protein
MAFSRCPPHSLCARRHRIDQCACRDS